MADQLYRVTWKPGTITVHASSPERARKIALEYLQAKELGFFETTIEEPAKDREP